MKVHIKFYLDRRKSDVCYFSRDILNSLELSEKEIYNLHLGQSMSQVTIKPVERKTEDKANVIYLNSSIFKSSFSDDELNNFEGTNMNIWNKGTNIYLGPVLGIFVKPRRLKKRKNKTTRSVHLQAGVAKNFLCYLFSVDSIDWSNNRVKGLTFVPKLNRWTNIWLPMPNVVYDRRSGFTREQRKKAKIIRKKFKNDLKIKYINNTNYFSKWKPYKKLKKHDSVIKYLPHTIRYKSFDDVLNMLNTHSFIFLKSFYGSKGKRVMSIEKLGANNKFKLGYSAKKLQEVEIIKINSNENLRKYVENFIGNSKFIVQQGIRLLRYEDRPFDLRVLVLKDDKGKWQALNNYARIAWKENQKITSPSSGSDRIFYQDIFSNLSGSVNVIIPGKIDIESVAIQIASYIDKELGPFGELGIDLAIDIYGNLWLLEVNTTPRKLRKLDKQYYDIHPKFTAIFDYAKYLCIDS